MATMKPSVSQQMQLGSASWVLEERRQVSELVDERVEDFYYRFAEKPLEWLNARMEDIFTGDELDVADVFKTPGKLRGKTPRTARKRNPLEDRAPLTDIFTSDIRVGPSPAHNTQFYQRVAQFQVAEDQENRVVEPIVASRVSAGFGKENSEISNHDTTSPSLALSKPQEITLVTLPQDQMLSPNMPPASRIALEKPSFDERAKSADESYITAAEEIQINDVSKSGTPRSAASVESNGNKEPPTTDQPRPDSIPEGLAARTSNQYSISTETVVGLDLALDRAEAETSQHSDSEHASEESSPAAPLIRKSSLTFACLPAREPLAAKKSGGNRTSRTSNLDLSRSTNTMQNSWTARAQTVEESEDKVDEIQPQAPTDAERPKTDSKTSTQRLQERLAMLGNTNSSRLSKSVALSQIAARSSNQDAASAPAQKDTKALENSVDVDDDWIGPISTEVANRSGSIIPKTDAPRSIWPSENATAKEAVADDKEITKPFVTKALPTNNALEPQGYDRGVVQPVFSTMESTAMESTTPAGSPFQRRQIDGPLSASKARFYSVLQSAKGIFANTAGASALAKTELLPPSGSHDKTKAKPLPNEEPQNPEDRDCEFDAKTSVLDASVTRKPADVSSNVTGDGKQKEPIVSRRSSVRIESSKFQQPKSSEHVEGKIEKAQVQGPNNNESDQEKAPAPPPKDIKVAAPIQKHGEARRPAKIGKEIPQKSRPAPVSVRVASQRIGQNVPSNAMLAATLHDSLAAAPVPTKAPALTKKGSNTSLHTASSTQNFKGSISSATGRPKALEAAARKKELDEREAQRKADQKRDLERRRAAKQEEERRAAQEQKAAEQQRAMEAKNAAQRQAADQRRAEAIRKNEEQRNQVDLARSQPSKDNDPALNERLPHQPKASKEENGMARPLSKLQSSHDPGRPPLPHVNPAKPPKRVFQPDADENWTKVPAAQNPAKRRRTSDEGHQEIPQRPTMAGPIRISAMRKDAGNRQTQHNPNMPSYGGASIHRNTVLSQHQAQHPKTPHMNDLSKSTNNRIVFAEAPNPPQLANTQQAQPPSRIQGPKTSTIPLKSSPHYPNGDSIDLPEIATDSEESDNENGDFVPPDWADSPALRELLRRQQLVDPMNVFGPIAPLMMEEVFKGSKDRHARFRARTSSANWNGPDRLTEEERRRDREAREQLEREGGWTFRGSA